MKYDWNPSSKELKGYELIEEVQLKCSSCNKPLVNIAKISEESRTLLSRYQAKCCYCKDTSWVKTITGTVCLSGIDGKTKTLDSKMIYKDNGEIDKCIIEVVKYD